MTVEAKISALKLKLAMHMIEIERVRTRFEKGKATQADLDAIFDEAYVIEEELAVAELQSNS